MNKMDPDIKIGLVLIAFTVLSFGVIIALMMAV